MLTQMLIPTQTLLRKYTDQVNYILFHGPEAKNLLGLVQGGKVKPAGTVMVENHVGKDALAEAIEMSQSLREAGVDAGFMFDFYHEMASNYHGLAFLIIWDQLLLKLSVELEKRSNGGSDMPVGVHLPIGTRSTDSLPVGEMTDSMLSEFAALRMAYPFLLVLENQQRGANALALTSWTIRNQERRNKQNFERFRKFNLL